MISKRNYICRSCYGRGIRTELELVPLKYQGVAKQDDWFIASKGFDGSDAEPATTEVPSYWHCPECEWRQKK